MSVPESYFATDKMTEQHELLGEAYAAWIKHEFPEAKTLGDVVILLRAQQATEPKELEE